VTAANDPPPAEVMEAFGVDPSDAPVHLPGGEGRAWRAGGIVLKPEPNATATAWLGEVLQRVADTPAFRLARPLRTTGGEWVVGGWQATPFLEGVHQSARGDDVLRVSDALHASIRDLDIACPDWLRRDGSPWAYGARVAWGEEPAPVDLTASAAALLARLLPFLAQPWDGPAPQLIHGDLAGNVLFDERLPPAVIDFSPAFRPAAFADAIVVADAVAWGSEPEVTAVRFLASRTHGDQLLARAIAFRLVAVATLWPEHPERIDAEADGYRGLLPLLSTR
jgi:uncharacterized protein (TIGR02569 family)